MDARLDGMRVLVLSTGFEPVRIVSWKRAMVLYLTEKIEVVDYYKHVMIRSVSRQFPLPAVVRMKRFAPYRRRNTARFSRQHVFMRDDHTCQYCLETFTAKELTLDHVVPIVRGGRTTWSNVVTSCSACNQRKGSKTPAEAGFHHFEMPAEPDPGFLPDLFHYRLRKEDGEERPELPESWRPFLLKAV
jgi:5-methylcytosine-specific restriction endonuclease McrA